LFRLLRTYAFIITGSLLFFCGCVSNTVYVPVVDVDKAPVGKTYVVQPGDTLYSIAWAFGLDFRKLVEINHLESPYHVAVGQTLWLSSPSVLHERKKKQISRPTITQQKRPVKFTVIPKSKSIVPKHAPSKHAPPKHWKTGRVRSWIMPARGRVVNIFSTKYGASGKGLEIHGRLSEPIKAAATGTVVYSGDGLRSYGNLLLIKHNDEYLSAYAFNKKLLVKAGDHVKQGQKIATMGRDGRGMPLLYFEIRRFGKPVNPIKYLKK
jgi:lipoprotein NlpD